jgi:cation diffusion facilitator family transporter
MRTEHTGHDHAHGMAKQTLRLAFFLTLFILAAELIGGFLANSLALLSDAGHVLTDIFALGLAWFATAQAERPADARKTFGYHRVGILAALVNALTLIVVALVILWEAVQRLQRTEAIQPLVMFLSAGIGIAVNLYIGFGLRKEGGNLNVRAAALHVFGDVGVSVGVVLAGLIILLTGWTPADPLLSVGVAALIAVGAWRILRETTDILLEATPRASAWGNWCRTCSGSKGCMIFTTCTCGASPVACTVLATWVIRSKTGTSRGRKISFPCLQTQEGWCRIRRRRKHPHARTTTLSCDGEDFFWPVFFPLSSG